MASRRTWLFGVGAIALVMVSACGSSGPAAKPVGGDQATVTPSVSATPAGPASSSPAQEVSGFEGEAPVQALRAWTAALARDVNAGDAGLSRARALSTRSGLAAARDLARDDLRRGSRLPGPEPFTPINVSVAGRQAKVTVCLLADGWSRNPKTGQPFSPRRVVPAVFVLSNEKGWKFVDLYTSAGDCGNVQIPEKTW